MKTNPPQPVACALATRRLFGFAACLLMMLSGCASGPSFWNTVQRTPPAGDSAPLEENQGILQTGMRLFYDPGPAAEVVNTELEQALEFYGQGDFATAQRKFNRIAYGRHSSRQAAAKALFFEAECLRMRQHYPDAAQTYTKLVQDFPRSAHHHDALQRMFDIANYWLDDTRAEMEAANDAEKSKRWFIQPVSFIQFDSTKPWIDREGHALNLLEKVYLNDINGPLGEKSMFFLGSVNFYRKDYREADHYFFQVTKFHPNGKYAARAMELSIMCKQLIPGGPEYDGRKVAEARVMVHQAMTAYPELAHQKGEFLQRQLYTINNQQAAKDFMIAKFYERTGHPGSAFFYYEIVRRRYPGTKYAKDASERMDILRDRAEQQGSWDFWSNLRFWERAPQEEQPPTLGQPGPGGPFVPQPGGAELAPPPRPLPPSESGGVQPLGWRP